MSRKPQGEEIVDSEEESKSSLQEEGPKKSLLEQWKPYEFAPDKAKTFYKKKLDRCGNSAMTAIELFCIECFGWSRNEAKECDAITCPLFGFNRRIFLGEGKKKRNWTDEQKKAASERIKKLHKKK